MNIALEITATATAKGVGINRYVRKLTEGLVAQAPSLGDHISLGCRFSRFKNRQYLPHYPGVKNFWIQEPVWPPLHPWQVVHGTDARVPAWRNVARVATVHDMTIFLFEGLSTVPFREKMRAANLRLAKICHRLIAISQSTKEDFLRFIDFPPERISVTHMAVDPHFQPMPRDEVRAVLDPLGLPPRYLLFVGEISARKNIIGLVQGFAASRLAQDTPLVLAGRPGFGFAEIQPILQPHVDAGRIRMLGYVADSVLPALYGGAEAFLFPTFYEGFGIPVAEALACGTPTVGGNLGAVPEVAGGHAVLVDPHSAQDIARGIEKAVGFTPQQRAAASQFARKYTWQATAQATRQVYQQAWEDFQS
ncbi:MAG: glycosyltransferase family 4 protein [Deltaproteobacteria bacterium]|nr:glycosyltransferase family 4 protein [Deltaproteobacteria bacterium]